MPVVYAVHVIELACKVFAVDWRFRKANPPYNSVLECP